MNERFSRVPFEVALGALGLNASLCHHNDCYQKERADAKTGRISTGLKNELGEVRCGAGMAEASTRGEKNNLHHE